MDGGDESGEAEMDEGKGRTMCDGEGICNSGWREEEKARQGEVDACLIQYSHSLKSEQERLRGRERQAEKRHVWTSRFVHVLRGRLPSCARDCDSESPILVKLTVLPAA